MNMLRRVTLVYHIQKLPENIFDWLCCGVKLSSLNLQSLGASYRTGRPINRSTKYCSVRDIGQSWFDFTQSVDQDHILGRWIQATLSSVIPWMGDRLEIHIILDYILYLENGEHRKHFPNVSELKTWPHLLKWKVVWLSGIIPSIIRVSVEKGGC
jgi:hypothetical protein